MTQGPLASHRLPPGEGIVSEKSPFGVDMWGIVVYCGAEW
jgi:hypothetical protein